MLFFQYNLLKTYKLDVYFLLRNIGSRRIIPHPRVTMFLLIDNKLVLWFIALKCSFLLFN
jgi:hypothetical protein